MLLFAKVLLLEQRAHYWRHVSYKFMKYYFEK